MSTWRHPLAVTKRVDFSNRTGPATQEEGLLTCIHLVVVVVSLPQKFEQQYRICSLKI